MDGAELAGATEEDRIEDWFLAGTQSVTTTVGQGFNLMGEVEHLIEIEPPWGVGSRPGPRGYAFSRPLRVLLALQQTAQIDITDRGLGLLETLMEFHPATDLLNQFGGDVKGARLSLE